MIYFGQIIRFWLSEINLKICPFIFRLVQWNSVGLWCIRSKICIFLTHCITGSDFNTSGLKYVHFWLIVQQSRTFKHQVKIYLFLAHCAPGSGYDTSGQKYVHFLTQSYHLFLFYMNFCKQGLSHFYTGTDYISV